MSKNLELAKEWFLRAQDDEISIKDILKDKKGLKKSIKKRFKLFKFLLKVRYNFYLSNHFYTILIKLKILK
jgi:hypothetical protein